MNLASQRRFLSRTAMALACAGGLYSSAAMADEHVLVLLDVTGSMTLQSVPGKTRLQVAKDNINNFLDTVAPTPRKYAFWKFSGTAATPVFNFSDNKTAAEIKAAVNLATAGGNTPLAHSICAGIDHLLAFLPNDFHIKRVYLATDGEENTTPVADQCHGPFSANPYPNLDAGSWQWKVRNKACTGFANEPGPCGVLLPPYPPGLTMIVDIDHLFTDTVPFAAAARSEGLEDAELTTGLSAAASLNEDATFFKGISQETKGRYASITPSTPPSQAAPLPGDANLDGCVNVTDRSLVLSLYGKTVPAGTPADFNRTLVVDSYDHQTVLNNFGRGCTATAK
ncbi:VWA domain-containing protein [Pyxidicoccus fallax]|uniref:VWA domain-containing protein n=1 Tax=Pyxidicoccus fallax TaxID=394095 RepID=A0A848LQE4_9BACT|nr:VWA domain-containing protein [Pyxidicoccus fallax]NMO19986.1 VWA domain-containing protein [Pyxidicoccus fallax]NPC80633.1 VWA domain-containing protein [Pyxidicoccus fallax]